MKEGKTKANPPVYTLDGRVVGELTTSTEFNKRKINPTALAQYVRVYLINQRQGTASTKTRSEVVGSTRKIYRQKGTGKARHGDIKAPIFVGGGIVGGPKPRHFHSKMNKQQIRVLIKDALFLKIKDQQLVGLTDDFLKISKTKNFANELAKFSKKAKRILLVVPNMKSALVKAARNIVGVSVITINSLNPYVILNHQLIVFMQSSWEESLTNQ